MKPICTLVVTSCLFAPSLLLGDELGELREEVRHLLRVELGVEDRLFLPWHEKRFQQLDEEQLMTILGSEFPVEETVRAIGEPGALIYRVLPLGCRVLDTRQQFGGALVEGEVRTFNVRGRLEADQGVGSGRTCGISANAVAITANLVAVGALGHGNMGLVASDQSNFGTAAINFGPGRALGGVDEVNGVTLRLCGVGCDQVNRDLKITARGTTVQAVVNVSGYFIPLEEAPAADLDCVDCVSGAEILNGTITSADVLDGSLTGTDIADATITSADVLDGSLSGLDIADGTVRSADLQDGTVTGTDVADATLTSADLQDGSVTGTDLADGTVRSVDVLDGSLTGIDLADNSVTSADLQDGAVNSIDLADGGVRSIDVLDGSLTGTDIADGSVTSADIQDGGLTGRDVGDGTLLAADVDLGYQIRECFRALQPSSINALECDCPGVKKIRGGGCVADTSNVDLFENFPYRVGQREGWQCSWKETAGGSGTGLVRAICADG